MKFWKNIFGAFSDKREEAPLNAVQAVTHADIFRLKSLLEKNPRLVFSKVRASPGGTLLHKAASEGHKDVLLVLLANGAEVDAKDDQGNTPLHKASTHSHRSIVEILLEHNAKLNVKNKFGFMPGQNGGLGVKPLQEIAANVQTRKSRRQRATEKGTLLCQNKECREKYYLDAIATISGEELMSWLKSSGATVTGDASGFAILVGHSMRSTTKYDLTALFKDGPKLGWQCKKCNAKNSWDASFSPSYSTL